MADQAEDMAPAAPADVSTVRGVYARERWIGTIAMDLVAPSATHMVALWLPVEEVEAVQAIVRAEERGAFWMSFWEYEAPEGELFFFILIVHTEVVEPGFYHGVAPRAVPVSGTPRAAIASLTEVPHRWLHILTETTPHGAGFARADWPPLLRPQSPERSHDFSDDESTGTADTEVCETSEEEEPRTSDDEFIDDAPMSDIE